jgi:hypothetical protein
MTTFECTFFFYFRKQDSHPAFSRQWYLPVFPSENYNRAAGTLSFSGVNIVKHAATGASMPFLEHPYPEWYTFKHHQWVILHRKHVEQLRASPVTMSYLAYSVRVPFKTIFKCTGMDHDSGRGFFCDAHSQSFFWNAR